MPKGICAIVEPYLYKFDKYCCQCLQLIRLEGFQVIRSAYKHQAGDQIQVAENQYRESAHVEYQEKQSDVFIDRFQQAV